MDLMTNIFLWISYKNSFKKWSETLSFILILFNPLSIISVWLLNTNIFWYFFFSFFFLLIIHNNREDELFPWLTAVLISFDFHYLLLILTTLLYWHESNKDTAKTFAKIAWLYAFLMSAFYYIYSYKQIVIPLNGDESMNMLWYFYTVWFQKFIPTFWYLIQLFPYSLILPTVLNVISLRTNARAYKLLPIDATGELNTKLKEFIKSSKDPETTFLRFRTLKNMKSVNKSSLPSENNEEAKENEEMEDLCEMEESNNFFLTQIIVVTFIYFMLTKPYFVSYDFIIVLPFMWRHWGLFSYSPAALIMIFGLCFTYGGQVWMWIAWQKRMVANVNNYWIQIFINSAVWGFVSYIINSKIGQKSKEYYIPYKVYYEHIKKKE